MWFSNDIYAASYSRVMLNASALCIALLFATIAAHTAGNHAGNLMFVEANPAFLYSFKFRLCIIYVQVQLFPPASSPPASTRVACLTPPLANPPQPRPAPNTYHYSICSMIRQKPAQPPSCTPSSLHITVVGRRWTQTRSMARRRGECPRT